MKVPTHNFVYQYLAGPVDSRDLLTQVTEGNCRYALQLYFYDVHGIWLEKDEIYLPGGYKQLGTFVVKEEAVDVSQLQPGDVIYAQNLKKKNGESLNRNPDQYKGLDEWRWHFHSAIYLGGNKIYHASSVCNGPATWTWGKFTEYYKPISAKRLDLG